MSDTEQRFVNKTNYVMINEMLRDTTKHFKGKQMKRLIDL